MSNPRALFRSLFTHAGDMLMAQDCFVCGAVSGRSAVCETCRQALPKHAPNACPVCALPTADAAVCGRCRRSPPAFDATRAVFDYAFPVDAMVHALKYRHRLSLARFVAGELAAALGFSPAVDIVLAMPLHPRRLAERGFNQAVEIARPLSRMLGLPLELSAASRIRDTPAQARLGRRERARNLRGAFQCGGDAIVARRVLVVDDVMTTGASLDALAVALRRAGASAVSNLVVARTALPD